MMPVVGGRYGSDPVETEDGSSAEVDGGVVGATLVLDRHLMILRGCRCHS